MTKKLVTPAPAPAPIKPDWDKTIPELKALMPKCLFRESSEILFEKDYEELLKLSGQIQIAGNVTGIIWFNTLCSFEYTWSINGKIQKVSKNLYSPIEVINAKTGLSSNRITKAANGFNPLTHNKTVRYSAMAYLLARLAKGSLNPSCMGVRCVAKILGDVIGYPDTMSILVKKEMVDYTKTELIEMVCGGLINEYIGFFDGCLRQSKLRDVYHPLGRKGKSVAEYHIKHEEDFEL